MRLRVIAAAVGGLALVALASACTPREGFDGWIARQPVRVLQAPVPCDRFPTACGSTGLYDRSTQTIYMDPVAIANMQNGQNSIDPSIDVWTMVYYHEWSHVADVAVGFVEGTTPLGLEHAAQCGMQLVTGRWYQFRTNGTVYWICSDAELARTRWIWTANGVI